MKTNVHSVGQGVHRRVTGTRRGAWEDGDRDRMAPPAGMTLRQPAKLMVPLGRHWKGWSSRRSLMLLTNFLTALPMSVCVNVVCVPVG
jgi:hypothetical protein